MIFDGILLVLILIFAVAGFRKGFLYSLIGSVGWIVALTGAVFGVIYGSEFLREHGFLYDYLADIFKNRFSAETDTLTPAVNSMPESIGNSLDSMIDGISNDVANGFASVCYTVLLFIAIFLIIKFFMWLALRTLSKKYNDGFTSFIDGIFGTLFGLIKAVIFISVVLLLAIPVVNLIDPELTEQFAQQMDASILTKLIYDNNPVSMLIQGFFGLS